jgi:RNA polymerase sigma-70 factor (ECF subfamily)
VTLEREHYARSQEAFLVNLARKGDRNAFEELVGRKQNQVRNLMRRCCGDATLADDLAQQTFLQAWRTIHRLQRPSRFGAWLKRVAINTWLQQVRKNDPLKSADADEQSLPSAKESTDLAMDLDSALAELPDPVRLCIVLSYHERMTHEEIAALTGTPLGTVKSHIRRGTQRLQKLLAAYDEADSAEERQ